VNNDRFWQWRVASIRPPQEWEDTGESTMWIVAKPLEHPVALFTDEPFVAEVGRRSIVLGSVQARVIRPFAVMPDSEHFELRGSGELLKGVRRGTYLRASDVNMTTYPYRCEHLSASPIVRFFQSIPYLGDRFF
jgi:hypothetical protein